MRKKIPFLMHVVVCWEVIAATLGIGLPTKPTLDDPLLWDSLHVVIPCISCETDGGSV